MSKPTIKKSATRRLFCVNRSLTQPSSVCISWRNRFRRNWSDDCDKTFLDAGPEWASCKDTPFFPRLLWIAISDLLWNFSKWKTGVWSSISKTLLEKLRLDKMSLKSLEIFDPFLWVFHKKRVISWNVWLFLHVVWWFSQFSESLMGQVSQQGSELTSSLAREIKPWFLRFGKIKRRIFSDLFFFAVWENKNPKWVRVKKKKTFQRFLQPQLFNRQISHKF